MLRLPPQSAMALSAQVLAQVCDQMCVEIRGRWATVVVVNLITVSLIWQSGLANVLVLWFLLTVLAQTPRWRYVLAQSAPQRDVPHTVYRRLFWLTVPIALAQASIVPLTWLSLTEVDHFVLTLVILGLCVGGIASVPGHVPAYAVYLAAMLGSATLAWMLTWERQGISIAVLLVLLAVVLLGFARRLRDQIASLVEQREKVRLSTEARSRFFAAANHDLRQPLQGVNMHAAALGARLAHLDDRVALQMCGQLQRGLAQSGQLLDALLDISRLDADVMEVKQQALHLQPLFDALREEFEPQVAGRGFLLQFEPGQLTVQSDPVILQRILRNLLSNAVKFTETGFVRVSAEPASGPGVNGAAILVEDTGVGIGVEHLERVFEEFYQAGNAARVREQGLGLGLAIVQRLVDLLGHRISLASRPGVGTVLRLTLPLAQQSSMAQHSVTATAGAMPRQVLVLDDELAVAQATVQLCTSVGVAASQADSIPQARQMLDQGLLPDLVIADERLKDPDSANIDSGSAFCAELRSSHPGLRVIIVTGETSTKSLSRLHQYGFTVLFKPIQGQTLLEAMRAPAV
jgi:signal transduction histidine kinase/ActR/RegA family two-component response regulator